MDMLSSMIEHDPGKLHQPGGTLFVIAVIHLAGLALFAFWNPKLGKKLDLSKNRI
jgi:hypothetical protein